MRTGLIAKKLGMTRLFDENGKHIPVTALHVENAQVTAILTEKKNGYNAVQIGVFDKKESRESKPMLGHFKKSKTNAKYEVQEFRVDVENLLELGSDVNVDTFEVGQYVDVTGTTKGRGFTGAMARWNFAGLRATHGVSISHRSHGSTGQCQYPGKVFKGKKMAGHYGDAQRTQQNIKVVKVDVEKGVILVKGSIPGSKGRVVILRDAVKKTVTKA